MRQFGESGGRLVDLGVGGVDAVDAGVRALQDGLSLDFCRAQRSSRVSCEEWIAGTAGKDDDATLLEVALASTADVGLGHLGHFDGGHHARVLSHSLERILQCKTIDDRRDHSHVVGLSLVHSTTTALGAAPEVAATDDDGNVDAELVAGFLQFAGELRQNIVVQTEAGLFGERLTRQFQDHAVPAGLGAW